MQQEAYRVFMVDDDTEDVYAIRKGLSGGKLGIDFTEISTPAGLFDRLHADAPLVPDVILLDINMPRMNGFEVLKHLKASDAFKDIPVFVLSTSSHEADRSQSMALGAAGFVTKFASMKNLREWIKSLETFLETNCGSVPENHEPS